MSKPPNLSRIRKMGGTIDSTAQFEGRFSLANGDVRVVAFWPRGITAKSIAASVTQGGHSWRNFWGQSTLSLIPGLDPTDFEEVLSRALRYVADQPKIWDGHLLGLQKAHITKSSINTPKNLTLNFAERRYSESLATQRFLEELSDNYKNILFGGSFSRVDPVLSASFGLNLTIETGDGLTILTKRSSHSATEGLWHSALSEGLSPKDADENGSINLEKAFWRGLGEELGLFDRDFPQGTITVHSIVLSENRYDWSLLGHLNLRGSQVLAEQIVRGFPRFSAHDSWEVGGFRLPSFTFEDVGYLKAELDRQDQWVPEGLMNLLLSFAYRFPEMAAEVSQLLDTKKILRT